MENHIAANISYLVKENKLSQDDFGGLFDLKKGVINQYILGKSLPKIETLQKISTFYKISIDDLINVDLSSVNYNKVSPANYVNEPGANYNDKDAIIAAQAKTIATLEKLIENLETRLRSAS